MEEAVEEPLEAVEEPLEDDEVRGPSIDNDESSSGSGVNNDESSRGCETESDVERRRSGSGVGRLHISPARPAQHTCTALSFFFFM